MKFIHLPRQSDFGMYPHAFAVYFTGTWAISGPQKPRIFMAEAQDGFAFKLRWC